MLTNTQLAQHWAMGCTEPKRNGSMSCKYEEGCFVLYSYATEIARHNLEVFDVTRHKYSVTTSRHCTLARYHAIKEGLKNVPIEGY